MDNRPGCITGIFKLFLFRWLFDFMESRFGFGRGASCGGCGCGLIILLIFLMLVCSTITSTNWFKLGMDLAVQLI
jgi:hypothetical protein